MERYSDSMTQDEVIHNGLQAIALQLSNLGNANAATPMGAVEAHGKFVSEAINSLTETVKPPIDYSEGLTDLCDAINNVAEALNTIADNMPILNV